MAVEADKSLLEFPTDVGSQIIRIIQEALINVCKHTRANTAQIHIRCQSTKLCISVKDRGRGFDLAQTDKTDQSGLGLEIMRERAESIGGNLKIKSAPGKGTKISLWMPIMSGIG